MKIIEKVEAINYVKSNGYKLDDVSGELQNDREVVLAAVNADTEGENAFAYASLDLRYNKSFMMQVLASKPMSLEHFEAPFQNNSKLVGFAVSIDAYALQYASERLKNHKPTVYKALLQDEQAIDFASSEIVELIGTDNPLQNMEKLIRSEKLNKKLQKSLAEKTEKKKPKI